MKYDLGIRVFLTKKILRIEGNFFKLPRNHKYFFICSDDAYFYITLSVHLQNNRI